MPQHVWHALGMDEIVIITGDELRGLLEYLAGVADSKNHVYQLRVCVDHGAAKFKVNAATWTPPYGNRETR